ncbi:MAG: PRC-barrel domain-containing protein [Streptosporangiaceae bacterium]
MADETEFAIGARASCIDGLCGKVSRIIVDPATDTVTHLVIEPKHRLGPARFVPVNLVDATDGDIRLRCTLAEFDQLDPAEEIEPVQGAPMGLGPGGMMAPTGIPAPVMTVVSETVPVGETDVSPGEHVHALDGEIGRVQGFLVDPGDHRVTHVVLQEGHLWGRKEVAIPVSAVTGMENGIRLNLTKKQVEDLPPVD